MQKRKAECEKREETWWLVAGNGWRVTRNGQLATDSGYRRAAEDAEGFRFLAVRDGGSFKALGLFSSLSPLTSNPLCFYL
jgi:hypothetical protein